MKVMHADDLTSITGRYCQPAEVGSRTDAITGDPRQKPGDGGGKLPVPGAFCGAC
ncbi:MAG: hypothetical protein FWF83_08520 [Clostridiales bacterium]|nr:hypothetical protein [Clostridiales bacterium]